MKDNTKYKHIVYLRLLLFYPIIKKKFIRIKENDEQISCHIFFISVHKSNLHNIKSTIILILYKI